MSDCLLVKEMTCMYEWATRSSVRQNFYITSETLSQSFSTVSCQVYSKYFGNNNFVFCMHNFCFEVASFCLSIVGHHNFSILEHCLLNLKEISIKFIP